jgi:hypothetical protein
VLDQQNGERKEKAAEHRLALPLGLLLGLHPKSLG